uniref:Uncharacterized protein n=1 Tax=Anguilla anguilla TaxID=7936 RepID=A0A0E9XM69_ANGAN
MSKACCGCHISGAPFCVSPLSVSLLFISYLGGGPSS